MVPEIDQFWNLVANSHVLTATKLSSVRAQLDGLGTIEAADRMMKTKLISPLQREVLLAGHAGPFRFGRYLIKSRLSEIAEPVGFQSFAAIDQKTGYSVRLQFFDGRSPDALEIWERVEAWVEEVCATTSDRSSAVSNAPHAFRHFEMYQTIALSDHRFIVRERPRGKTLAQIVPPKSRLGASQAILIVTQLAEAFAVDSSGDDLTEPDLISAAAMPVKLNRLMNCTWMGTGKCVRIDRWKFVDRQRTDEMLSDQEMTVDGRQQSFLLGVLLLRLTTGRELNWKWNKQRDWFVVDAARRSALIERLEQHTQLQTLLEKTLTDQCAQSLGINDFYQHIHSVSEVNLPPPSFSQSRDQFVGGLGAFSLPQVQQAEESIPDIDTSVDTTGVDSFADSQKDSDGDNPSEVDPRVRLAREAAAKRRSGRWKKPVAVVASLLLLGACLVGWGLWAGARTIRSVPVAQNNVPQPQADLPTDRSNAAQRALLVEPKIDYSQVAYVQKLVDDDQATLWESPTTGLAIEFQWLPSAAAIVLQTHARALAERPGGKKILDALGPDFQSRLRWLEQRAGVSFDDMETLTVALVPEGTDGYQPFFQITTRLSREQLLTAWGQPDEIQIPGGATLYSTDQLVWFFVPDEQVAIESTVDAFPELVTFVFGQPTTVQQVVQDGGVVVWRSALEDMRAQTDRDRHVNLLALTSAIVNENSQGLWGQWSSRLRPKLNVLLPDESRALNLSLHLDRGEYIEFKIDHSVDVKVDELAEQLRDAIGGAIVDANAFTQLLAPIDYWLPLQNRYAAMLSQFGGALRWGSEFDQLIANGWLAPDATQNLLAGAELAITFSDSVGAERRPTLPANLKELLAKKRSLNVNNPPDLNVLLQEIQNEVVDDYPGLGFPFRIKMLGGDLRVEGITQNQRPGPLAIKDAPLATILTQIMTSANPDKSISGAADPNCKLVWVVANDPDDPQQQVILITTRAAAKEKDYSLPDAFVEK